MKNLTTLRIENNRIKGNLESIVPFSKLPRLVELIISHNKITYIENLHHFKRLFTLILEYNEISNVKTSILPPDLEFISFNHNQITNFDDIYDTYWKGLVNVYLAHNYLHSFSVPEPLEYLEYIDLSDNYITSVKNLKKIIHLHTLNLQRNPLPSDMIQNLRNTYPHVQIEYP